MLNNLLYLFHSTLSDVIYIEKKIHILSMLRKIYTVHMNTTHIEIYIYLLISNMTWTYSLYISFLKYSFFLPYAYFWVFCLFCWFILFIFFYILIFVNIFSLSIGCLLSLIMVPFLVQRFSILNLPHLLIIVIFICAPRQPPLFWYHKNIRLYFWA